MARLDEGALAGVLGRALSLPDDARMRLSGLALDPELVLDVPACPWADIEGSGLTGLPALRAVLGALGKLPVPVVIEIVQDEAWRAGVPWNSPGQLLVTYWVPDAYNPAAPRKQKFTIMIPEDPPGVPAEELPGPREWAAWLLRVFCYLACHEVQEFFVVGGERLFDPHAAGAENVAGLPPHPVFLRGRM